MKRMDFHHPDISLPVIRHQIGNGFLYLLEVFGTAMLTRGRSLAWKSLFPSETAYRSAKYRLRKNGLIVETESPNGKPMLSLTEKGNSHISKPKNPHGHWDRKWNGIWYVLIYDVPEADRVYRDTLRNFLQKMRMGCLQRSTWITPHDIRSQYHDLAQAADIERYAILFESKTVLKKKPAEIIESAWDFDSLIRSQIHFIRACENNAGIVSEGNMPSEEIIEMAQAQLLAYLGIMESDPLLPRSLWPDGYRGPELIKAHKHLLSAMLQALHL